MSEAKTPLPGEYWVSDDGSLIRIVGVKLNGGVIYENQTGLSFQFNSMTNWHYEPRCTSFEWVEPQPPDPGEGYEVLPDGEVLQEGDQFEAIGKWRNTNNAGRKKLPGWTYRRKIKPVESPDDWVEITDPEHVLRKSIDEVMPTDVGFVPVTSKAGCTLKQTGFTAARCRRRDLPAAAPKRIPVRLWVSHRLPSERGDWPMRCTPADEAFDNSGACPWLEVRWDASGFYVTEGGLHGRSQ